MRGAPRRCLYAVLEVDPKADESEIKKAYRKLALVWHPDKHGEKSAAELEEVNQRFLEVQEAWRVLSDAQEKAWYDDHREDILR
jgi:DnaJ family protein A protein 5